MGVVKGTDAFHYAYECWSNLLAIEITQRSREATHTRKQDPRTHQTVCVDLSLLGMHILAKGVAKMVASMMALVAK